MGYGFTGGVKFPIFLLILALTLQQCSANALPVISPYHYSIVFCILFQLFKQQV